MLAAVRVLTIGNMYPPHHLGGYELTWRSAVAHMRDAGHAVRVLTTDYRRPGVMPEELEDRDVHRELRWYWREHEIPRIGPGACLALERHNARTLARHLRELRPEAVNWWAMGGMSLSMIERVRRRGLPAVGVVGDEWMLYAPLQDSWARTFLRHPRFSRPVEWVSRIPTRFQIGSGASWLFNSEYVRRRTLQSPWDLRRSSVLHPGVDHDLFRAAPALPWRWRMLYVGRIDERKGIETAIRALGSLASARLTVLGGGDDQYLRRLHGMVSDLDLTQRVTFSRVPREKLPDEYAEADVLVFPASWEEPWGLVPLEAMAVGTPVVATGRGGSAEYLEHERNCLIVPSGDVPALAAAVGRLADEPGLRERLREQGLETAKRYDERHYNQAIREALEQAAA